MIYDAAVTYDVAVIFDAAAIYDAAVIFDAAVIYDAAPSTRMSATALRAAACCYIYNYLSYAPLCACLVQMLACN